MAEISLEELRHKKVEHFDNVDESLYSVEPILRGSEIEFKMKMGEVFMYKGEDNPDEGYYTVVDNQDVKGYTGQATDGTSLAETFNELSQFIEEYEYEPYGYGEEISAFDDMNEASGEMNSKFPQFSIADLKGTLRDEILREICADELDYETEKEAFESIAV